MLPIIPMPIPIPIPKPGVMEMGDTGVHGGTFGSHEKEMEEKDERGLGRSSALRRVAICATRTWRCGELEVEARGDKPESGGGAERNPEDLGTAMGTVTVIGTGIGAGGS
jgi:hypothetical protein